MTPPRRSLPGRVRAFALVAGALALACGVSVPPSGGPEDTTPPRVAGSTPAPDSAGVAVDAPIRITFSEDMTRSRVERAVSVSPPITVDRVRWDGRTLEIVPLDALARDTTYVVQVKPDYRDHHGVPARRAHEFAFATGAVLDTASIAGTVYFKREPSSRAVVRGFRLPRGDDFDPAAARPDRETATGADGTYRLRYLPANDARFVLFAFVDANGNGRLDTGESSAARPDTVVLTPVLPVAAGIDFAIIDPNEPATVGGSVANQTGIDTVRVSVSLTAVVADGAGTRLYRLCDQAGAFEFTRVPAGRYLLQAFLDIARDSVCGEFDCPDGGAVCVEPCIQLPDTLVVGPGAAVAVPPFALRRTEDE